MQGTERAGFEFRGHAGEWFGIWIVNVLLTIATLGICSAWAKVRKNRYFHGNTFVAGRNFDYHATGLQILVGRLIVGAGLVAFSILGAVPEIAVVLALALLVALPFLLRRALRFNAAMSSWSNVRFGFEGGAGGVAKVYLLYPFLAALTLQATAPLAARAMRRYAIANHRLGGHRFALDAPIWPFYRAALIAVGWVVLVLLATILAVRPFLATR